MRSSRLVPATFSARPNRFIVEARLTSGRLVQAHLADPGRIRELLIPNALLRLRPAPHGAARSTRYSVALVRSSVSPRPWVSLDTTLPNRLAEDLLTRGFVVRVGKKWTIQREFRHGRSRFDFRLHCLGGDEILVEVKSVTLVVEGLARFPDAPTARGTRHLRELERYARSGGRALLLFIVQRDDARAVVPNNTIDPAFTHALVSAARAGVLLRAVRFHLTPSGRATYRGPLPIHLH